MLIVCMIFSFVACSLLNNTTSNENNQSTSGTKINGNRVVPNLSKVELRKESSKVTKCKDEEMLIDSLEAFANPNANEFDAISILGKFRYTEEYNKLRNRLYTATRQWHSQIIKSVGEKCKVDIDLIKKTPVSLSDARVKDWQAANGKTPEAYSNVKCNISTNYASKSITLSFDIVKVDGAWYLANTGTISKLQTIITTDIYK